MMPSKVALVTGATRGIGLAIAEELCRDYRVLIGGRDPERTALIAETIPGAIPFVADLAKEDEIDIAIEEVVAPLGRLDALINNAGIAAWGHLRDSTREEWRRVFEINLFGMVDLTTKVLPYVEAVEGTVVNVNSGAGLNVSEGFGVYSASKFAVRAFTDALRIEHGDKIRVTGVHPGRVSTRMQREIEAAGGSRYTRTSELNPDTVALSVRAALDMPSGASIDSVRIRPTP